MTKKAISRNSLLLGLFALVTTAGIAGTYLATKDAIYAQKRAVEQEALLEIFPRSGHDNSMLDDTFITEDNDLLQLTKPRQIYVAKKTGKVVGFIIPATAPDAYTAAIELIVGVNIDGSVAGVRILAHRETPGLGDKVELKKSDWVLGFNGKSLFNPKQSLWKVKKDKGVFDQFTGATITPRAVTKAIFNVLQYFEKNKAQLLESTRQLAQSNSDLNATAAIPTNPAKAKANKTAEH